MKIGILTHYNVNNQGARLQMFCLSEWLKEHGHEVKILTYEKNYDFHSDELKKNSASFSNLFYYIKEYLFKKGIGLTLFNYKKVKKHKGTENLLSYEPYDSEDLDLVIVGSDEVFSIDVGFNEMMFGYGLKAPVIAYAPSFGKATEEDLKEHNVYDKIKDGLGTFTCLSARDSHTKELMKSLTNEEIPIVCDPVILYNGDFLKTGNRVTKKKYMIVYSYDRNMVKKDEIKAIKEYAKKNNLITVSLGTYHKWCDKNIACDSLSWYSYFSEAECVITDTFHGYVVSLKNQCNVALFIRESINAFKLRSLAKETGSEDRILKEITASEIERVLSQKPNYEVINKNLEKMIENGEEYLLSAIESVAK